MILNFKRRCEIPHPLSIDEIMHEDDAGTLCSEETIKAPFTRDRIQMGSDPFGSDPLFERRLHWFGSRTVRVYTGSDPFGFYGFSAVL